VIFFYGEKFLESCPISKLEDHLASAVRYCLFNVFAATLHIGGRSFIRKLRTRHTVVTGTHLNTDIHIFMSEKYSFSLRGRFYDLKQNSRNIIIMMGILFKISKLAT